MDALIFNTIAHNSPEYMAEVALRHAILRQPLGLVFSAEQLAAEADSQHIGAYLEQTLVACLVLKPLNPRQVQMRQVAVDTQLQGKGIGRRLVAHAEMLARQTGYQEMHLHARESAVAFYQSLGYATHGELFTEIGIPHCLMVKGL
ncbi:GNAT family N-acetyltransferase [Methylovorus mays]|uniref:GNAT family N-acetyltransferase n=1 Tax=Methylovorus mays TaxID=184077 RepID=UPI001E38A07E|nr:GNAT family N-acetyltransferase [Methylovorus mays]MCB5207003.1 GNAT family N-acetyltransferase [Methylovorus mays]